MAESFKPRLIRTPEEAELAVRDWLRAHGFVDAELTPRGPDAGVDVVSSDVVVQVKAEMVPIGRPIVQAIAGIAAAVGKTAALFSLGGVTNHAREFASTADVALFRFDLQGRPQTQNEPARDLQLRHARERGHDRVTLGTVGQLLVGHIEARRMRRNLLVTGFAPNASPLSAFRSSPLRNELSLGAATIAVRWIDNAALSAPPMVPDPAGSPFDPSFVWDPPATPHLDDPADWAAPTLSVEMGGGRNVSSACPHQAELCSRLRSLALARPVRITAYGGINDDVDGHFDLHKPGAVTAAVQYVEEVLRAVGSSVERLHWWAFDQPSGPEEDLLTVDSDYFFLEVNPGVAEEEVQRVVAEAQLWAGNLTAVAPLSPPNTFFVDIPADLPTPRLDAALDLLQQLEDLGARVRPE